MSTLPENLRTHLEQLGRRAVEAAARHQAIAAIIAKREGVRLHSAQGAALQTIENVGENISAVTQSAGHLADVPWDDPRWSEFEPDVSARHGHRLTRVGTLAFELKTGLDQGTTLHVPAMVPVVGRGNLVFRSRTQAGQMTLRKLQQTTALRLLAGVPAGRMRLALFDPVGLGQNFSHLLRLDEFLRGPMAWHKPQQMEDALDEITSNISMLIQKYLRNEYEDIEAYNEAVNEIAEPYRLVLVSDFPSGFDAKAARALLSIAQNGPRVGVYVLMTWDMNRKLPDGITPEQLLEGATQIEEREDGTLVIEEGPLSHGTLIPDEEPPLETINRITDLVSEFGRHAQNVVVPFTSVEPEVLWIESTDRSLAVPVGRSGASIQKIHLGIGTAHHALIGGTTGSGKSVLLHALIISAALRFSPDQLQIYLIDFKEGVEMAPYRHLPHARVVAIESEREFGVSVLRGIDDEISRRGAVFRAAGASDLRGYRENSREACPRILLIVDEFQVFFERNDKLADEARRLIDNIARQGRSFGIHAVLSSQTFLAAQLDAGTVPQFGVRIALRMGEADSQRLLGKDNDEARYLDRPGEAIYNDHAGVVGSNRKFQVAYLSTADRTRALDLIRREAERHKITARPLVFEGSRPASIDNNDALTAAVLHEARAYSLFVGEPVAVRNAHAAFRLRRQSRSHLLLCGSDESAAAAVISALLVSFLRQVPAGFDLRLHDLSNVDSPQHGFMEGLRMHAGTQVCDRRVLPQTITDLHTELERRIAAADAGEPGSPTSLLVLFGLQGARDLQADGHRIPEAAQQLHRILRDGPDLGMHVVMWSNTHARVMSVLDSRALKEIDTVIALRGGDSNRLLPPRYNDAAIKAHYGLLARQEEPEAVDKFRTYGDSAMTALHTLAVQS